MKDYSLMSMVEIAVDIQSQPNTEKTTFLDLYNKVCEIKGFTDEEKKAHIAQFYTDITASGDFLYCGEDLWDLKKNQKLEDLDKEFYSEHVAEETDEDEEEIKPKRKVRKTKRLEVAEEDYNDDDNNEDNENAEAYENLEYDNEEEDEDNGYNGYEPDFDHDEDDDYDDDDSDREEEKYNDIMDEYEDLYND